MLYYKQNYYLIYNCLLSLKNKISNSEFAKFLRVKQKDFVVDKILFVFILL
jgi:hypothetical protein